MYLEVGEPLTDADGADYEYNLYSKALTLYPNSPSAGYELLRFGRVINTDNETLSPAGAPCGERLIIRRKVVNLAAASVKVFSDADFPTGWDGNWLMMIRIRIASVIHPQLLCGVRLGWT